MLTNVYYVDDLSKKEKYKQEGKKLFNHHGPLVTGSQRHKNILKQMAAHLRDSLFLQDVLQG